MKKKNVIAFVMLITGTVTASAQLKVNCDGDVFITKDSLMGNATFNVGGLPANDPYSPSMYSKSAIIAQQYGSDTDEFCIGVFGEAMRSYPVGNENSIGVWGHGAYASGSKNIGVLGTINPNENGTAIQGTTEAWPWYYLNGVYAGYFYGDTYVNGDFASGSNYIFSDIRLKDDIVSLSSESDKRGQALEKLTGLDVIEYNMRRPGQEYEREAEKGSERAKRKEVERNRRHYGISAQELQNVYPNLVLEGQDGYLSVNYTEMVPLLICALQELKEKIAVLESGSSKDTRRDGAVATAVTTTSVATTGNVLYQNTPNPFKEKTVIRFSLAPDIQNASICVFDMSGKMLKTLPVSANDNSVSINGYELGEGMFLYSLLVNGQEIDTKRMVITK